MSEQDGSGAGEVPGSAAGIEEAIQAKRDHLAATIDELTARAQPKELARRSLVEIQRKLQALTHTDEGELRSERLAAAAGALVVVAGVLALIRRRR